MQTSLNAQKKANSKKQRRENFFRVLADSYLSSILNNSQF